MLRAFMLTSAMALATTAMAQAQEFSDGKIKVGVLTDMSGTYSGIAGPGSVEAARMAIEDMGGKIGGVPIELVTGDHQNKADIASGIAREWFDVGQVDVVIDMVNSATGLAVQGLAAQRGKLTINTGAGSTALTGANCSPTGIHYAYDNYAMAKGTGATLVKQGGDSWYFLTADYTFGHDLKKTTTAFIEAAGGKVLGEAVHPFPTADMSSFLLQAQASGAKVIGLANAGQDTINAIKQAHEFGITEAGQTLAGMLVFISDIHALGLETAKGLTLTTGYYWDMDDQTRAFAKRFGAAMGGAMPTMTQAGDYSALTNYLKAVQKAGSDDGAKVVAAMREMPLDDFFARHGRLREDGRMVHDMYLVQVKTPEESKGPWDYYKILATIPAEEAYRPLAESECKLVKK